MKCVCWQHYCYYSSQVCANIYMAINITPTHFYPRWTNTDYRNRSLYIERVKGLLYLIMLIHGSTKMHVPVQLCKEHNAIPHIFG